MSIKIYIPTIEDLWFRKTLLTDKKTMSFNISYGGAIDFNEDKWNNWYLKWIENDDKNYFYAYLIDDNNYVGEIAYHFDLEIKKYIANIIIHNKYRHKGYGKQGLILLCEIAKTNGIDYLYDDIAIDNDTAINLFLSYDFIEEYRNDEIIMLKKKL